MAESDLTRDVGREDYVSGMSALTNEGLELLFESPDTIQPRRDRKVETGALLHEARLRLLRRAEHLRPTQPVNRIAGVYFRDNMPVMKSRRAM